MTNPELNPGEMICPDCEGTGFKDRGEHSHLQVVLSLNKCTTCYGAKKLDWIENIVGKEMPVFGLNSTSFTCTNLTHQPKAFNPNDVDQYIKGVRNCNVLLTTEIPDMAIKEVAIKLAERIDANLIEQYKKRYVD